MSRKDPEAFPMKFDEFCERLDAFKGQFPLYTLDGAWVQRFLLKLPVIPD